jgi:hypothetical protein
VDLQLFLFILVAGREPYLAYDWQKGFRMKPFRTLFVDHMKQRKIAVYLNKFKAIFIFSSYKLK